MERVPSFEVFLQATKSRMNSKYPFLSQEQIMLKLRDQWKKLDSVNRQKYSKLKSMKPSCFKPKVVSVGRASGFDPSLSMNFEFAEKTCEKVNKIQTKQQVKSSSCNKEKHWLINSKERKELGLKSASRKKGHVHFISSGKKANKVKSNSSKSDQPTGLSHNNSHKSTKTKQKLSDHDQWLVIVGKRQMQQDETNERKISRSPIYSTEKQNSCLNQSCSTLNNETKDSQGFYSFDEDDDYLENSVLLHRPDADQNTKLEDESTNNDAKNGLSHTEPKESSPLTMNHVNLASGTPRRSKRRSLSMSQQSLFSSSSSQIVKSVKTKKSSNNSVNNFTKKGKGLVETEKLRLSGSIRCIENENKRHETALTKTETKVIEKQQDEFQYKDDYNFDENDDADFPSCSFGDEDNEEDSVLLHRPDDDDSGCDSVDDNQAEMKGRSALSRQHSEQSTSFEVSSDPMPVKPEGKTNPRIKKSLDKSNNASTKKETPKPAATLKQTPNNRVTPKVKATTRLTPKATTSVTLNSTTRDTPKSTTRLTPKAKTIVTPKATTRVTPKPTTRVTPKIQISNTLPKKKRAEQLEKTPSKRETILPLADTPSRRSSRMSNGVYQNKYVSKSQPVIGHIASNSLRNPNKSIDEISAKKTPRSVNMNIMSREHDTRDDESTTRLRKTRSAPRRFIAKNVSPITATLMKAKAKLSKLASLRAEDMGASSSFKAQETHCSDDWLDELSEDEQRTGEDIKDNDVTSRTCMQPKGDFLGGMFDDLEPTGHSKTPTRRLIGSSLGKQTTATPFNSMFQEDDIFM